MKLVLDASALNAMIGGDSQIEIEVRNGIVQEFVKKRLKGILSDPAVSKVIQDLTNDFKKSCQEEARGVVTRIKKGYIHTPDLDQWVQDAIKTAVAQEVNSLVKKEIEKIIVNVTPFVNDCMKHYGERAIRKLVEDKFQKVLAKVSK